MKPVFSCQYQLPEKLGTTTEYWLLILMPFACIYVPNFPVAAAFRAEPELQARAVAILEGKPPLEKIIAVNEKAGPPGHRAGHDQGSG